MPSCIKRIKGATGWCILKPGEGGRRTSWHFEALSVVPVARSLLATTTRPCSYITSLPPKQEKSEMNDCAVLQQTLPFRRVLPQRVLISREKWVHLEDK